MLAFCGEQMLAHRKIAAWKTTLYRLSATDYSVRLHLLPCIYPKFENASHSGDSRPVIKHKIFKVTHLSVISTRCIVHCNINGITPWFLCVITRNSVWGTRGVGRRRQRRLSYLNSPTQPELICHPMLCATSRNKLFFLTARFCCAITNPETGGSSLRGFCSIRNQRTGAPCHCGKGPT
jgi:hypothetical protein